MFASYKNERIKDLQQYATNIGVDNWKQKYMVQWLLQENGALSERTLGDKGAANGLCQCNKIWRDCHAWDNYEGQKRQCLDWFNGYTQNSTHSSILSDIRKSHNSRSATYEDDIKGRERHLLTLNNAK